jgi:hypothetical protein
MKRIIELGDGKNVYARYNTNLSRVDYRGVNLWADVLAHLRDWQICASLDGTGPIGEYIRTGLNYAAWLKNFKQGLQYTRHPRQMRIDFTLTLPGLFEVLNIQKLSTELGIDILAKVVFSFTPDIILSPLSLPRHLLEPWLDELIPTTHGALQDVLIQLKTRPTFAEQWPDQWRAGLAQGKARVLKLETIRNDSYTLNDILSARPEIQKWYNEIT